MDPSQGALLAGSTLSLLSTFVVIGTCRWCWRYAARRDYSGRAQVRMHSFASYAATPTATYSGEGELLTCALGRLRIAPHACPWRALWRSVHSVMDAVFSVLTIGQVAIQVQTAPTGGVSPVFQCGRCLYLALVTQFVLLGSELVFLMLSLDLLAALTNPFANYRHNRRLFMAIVVVRLAGWTAALVTSGVTMARGVGATTAGVRGVMCCAGRVDVW